MLKKRILIVEDDVLTAMDLEAIVSTTVDAEILVCHSVAHAKKALDEPVALALLDIDVTNGKTFDVAMLLQARKVPYIFVSGSRREEIPTELINAPFIPKPFNGRQVSEQILLLISG